MKTRLLLLTAAMLGLSGCGEIGGSPSAARNARATIELADVTAPEGCLNLPKYFEALRSVHPGTSAMLTTTKLDLTSKRSIRTGFRQSLAYGTFLFEERNLADLTDFPPVVQTECKTIAFVDADDGEGEYKIIEAKTDRLLAENAEGRRIGYRWLSPTSVEIETRYPAFDVPCSEATEILVDHVKVVDWSSRRLETLSVGSDSPMSIDRDYLRLLGEALGRDSAELFENRGDGEVLVAAKLREWRTLPPTEQLRTCGNVTHPPTSPSPGEPVDQPAESEEPAAGTPTAPSVPPETPSEPSDESSPEPTPAPAEPAPAEPAPAEPARGVWNWF